MLTSSPLLFGKKMDEIDDGKHFFELRNFETRKFSSTDRNNLCTLTK